MASSILIIILSGRKYKQILNGKVTSTKEIGGQLTGLVFLQFAQRNMTSQIFSHKLYNEKLIELFARQLSNLVVCVGWLQCITLIERTNLYQHIL